MDIVSKYIMLNILYITHHTHTPCDIEDLKTIYSDRRVAESVALALVTSTRSVVQCM